MPRSRGLRPDGAGDSATRRVRTYPAALSQFDVTHWRAVAGQFQFLKRGPRTSQELLEAGSFPDEFFILPLVEHYYRVASPLDPLRPLGESAIDYLAKSILSIRELPGICMSS